jgi:spore germination protein GerM
MAVLSAACGIQAESTPELLDPSSAPLREVQASASPAPTGTDRALVYLNRDGVLVAVVRRVPAQVTPSQVLAVLANGPTPREKDASLASAVPPTWHSDDRVNRDGTVTVRLGPGGASGSRTDEVLAYAQVVLTLTSLPQVKGVLFSRGATPLPVPRADGSLSDQPLTRRDYVALL